MMGVLTKTLPTMKAVRFDGFKPDPEISAARLMHDWMDSHPDRIGSHRVFGYNIDQDGHLAHDPDNYGYRLLLTLPEGSGSIGIDADLETIDGGNFVVTGIEGSFEEDPTGAWITEGWNRLAAMVEKGNYTIHSSRRWFEEPLEPVEQGHVRFDLYLEII